MAVHNTSSRTRWHQGYGVIVSGRLGPRVPFIKEDTARRIAASAAMAGFPSGVVRDHSIGGWAFLCADGDEEP
jgi:hypothetical protein